MPLNNYTPDRKKVFDATPFLIGATILSDEVGGLHDDSMTVWFIADRAGTVVVQIRFEEGGTWYDFSSVAVGANTLFSSYLEYIIPFIRIKFTEGGAGGGTANGWIFKKQIQG